MKLGFAPLSHYGFMAQLPLASEAEVLEPYQFSLYNMTLLHDVQMFESMIGLPVPSKEHARRQ